MNTITKFVAGVMTVMFVALVIFTGIMIPKYKENLNYIENQNTILTNQIATLNNEISAKETEIENLNQRIQSKQSQLDALTEEYNNAHTLFLNRMLKEHYNYIGTWYGETDSMFDGFSCTINENFTYTISQYDVEILTGNIDYDFENDCFYLKNLELENQTINRVYITDFDVNIVALYINLEYENLLGYFTKGVTKLNSLNGEWTFEYNNATYTLSNVDFVTRTCNLVIFDNEDIINIENASVELYDIFDAKYDPDFENSYLQYKLSFQNDDESENISLYLKLKLRYVGQQLTYYFEAYDNTSCAGEMICEIVGIEAPAYEFKVLPEYYSDQKSYFVATLNTSQVQYAILANGILNRVSNGYTNRYNYKYLNRMGCYVVYEGSDGRTGFYFTIENTLVNDVEKPTLKLYIRSGSERYVKGVHIGY